MTDDRFDFDAEAYDDDQDFVAEYGRELVDLLAPAPGERILDLGCGTGRVTGDIAARVGDDGTVVGIDASPAMVERARERYPELTFERIDAADLETAVPFDAVFSNAVLHWIDDQDAVLSAVADALRPGGRFVAEFGAAGNVAGTAEAVQAEGRKRGVQVELPWHFPTLGAYTSRLERHGFEVRLARTFDRDTDLDGPDGLRSWLDQFGDALLAPFDASARDDVVAAVEDRLRDERYNLAAEYWTMCYRRLQFRAVRLDE